MQVKISAVASNSDKEQKATLQVVKQDSSNWDDDKRTKQNKLIFWLIRQLTTTPAVPGQKPVAAYVAAAAELLLQAYIL